MYDMKKTLFFFLFLVGPAFASDAGGACEAIGTSRQVAECAKYKRVQSDKLLNRSYKATVTRIRHQYEKVPPLGDDYISLLRVAQLGWIKLRDADCKLEAFEIEETAEAYQVTINNCIARMSDDRASYLNRIALDI